MVRKVCIGLAALGLLLGAAGCEEEGPAERAGRQVDEAVEDLRGVSEGPLERLGREVDEAVDETREAAEEMDEAAREATR